ncbi:hypothetical protein LAZ29_19650 [Cereibacter sphaeroides]|uniref:lipid II flippase MurJ n=1 Tax=Cereibacter sphaeroides TaxID=1063 RepID=UPI001F38B8CD|nr:lipid II flippase MurJ [Cereibacter sphaeroides]MCE6953146.1 hypothetical protein [Cereibacter sphaeroides]
MQASNTAMTAPANAATPAKSRLRVSSLLSAVLHFGGQLVGILLALLVSHLIARRLGISPEADAFFFGRRIATSVIETLSQVMAVFYIPLVAAHAIGSGRGFLRATLRHAGIAAVAGVGLSLLIGFGAGAATRLLAPGLEAEAAVLARQTLMIFAAVLPATMACIVFAAALNVAGHFGMPSMIRQLPRAAIAATLAVAGANLVLMAAGAFAVAWLVVAAIMLVQCLRMTRVWEPEPGIAAQPARPLAVGTAAVLLVVAALASTWLETAFAAQVGTGGITRLELTQRLGTLLGNALATALSLVVFTAWSRRAAAGGRILASDLWRNVFIGLALLLPVQVYVALHSPTLVSFLLGHGRFGDKDVQDVAESLRWMTLAPLSAFVLRMVLVRILVDRALPVVRLVAIGVSVDTGVKFLLFLWLTPALGVNGIVLGQAISPLVTLALLAGLLRGRGVLVGPVRLGRESGLAVAAMAAIAGIILASVSMFAFSGVFGPDPSAASDFATLALSGLLGLALFFVSIKVLRVSVALD